MYNTVSSFYVIAYYTDTIGNISDIIDVGDE
jgi:hypothetical protein